METRKITRIISITLVLAFMFSCFFVSNAADATTSDISASSDSTAAAETAAAADSKYFTDVDTTNYSWLVAAVDYLYEKEIITGTATGKFEPGKYITRGDFMVILSRAFSLSSSETTNFSDVSANSYYYNAIGIAKALGIATGATSSEFKPEADLIKQDAVVFINRALAVNNAALKGSVTALNVYSDSASIADYAKDAMAAFTENGIIAPSADNALPAYALTRGEAALMLYLTLDPDAPRASEYGTISQVFYPNVYSDAEEKTLSEFAASLQGASGAMSNGEGSDTTGANQGGLAGNDDAQTSTDALMGMTAELDDMLEYASAFDYWNPLFNDEQYAKTTKYGEVIGVPFYKEAGAMFPTINLTPILGDSWNGSNDGGDFTFYLPVKAGDTFTMGKSVQTFYDATPESGSTSRTFNVSGTGTLLNQDGEVVVSATMYGSNGFTRTLSGEKASRGAPGGGTGGAPAGSGGASDTGAAADSSAPPAESATDDTATEAAAEVTASASSSSGEWDLEADDPDASQGGGMGGGYTSRHTYTDADWDYITELWEKEYVRGADTLYYEDVKVGDIPAYVCTGPTTVVDMIKCFGSQIMSGLPMREALKNKSSLVGLTQDDYGVYHLMEEGHFGDQGVEGNVPIFYMAYGRSVMVRELTNYAGDDGWLYKYSYRNGSLANDIIARAAEYVPELEGKTVTGHGSVGDCLIGKSVVVNKYIDNSDPEYKYKVELVVWVETLDGTLSQAGTAIISVESKNS